MRFLSAACFTTILLLLLPACSKRPAKVGPCELLQLGEAQSIDGAIVKTQSYPPQKGEELCVYLDQGGEGRLMLFVWRDKRSDPASAVRAGMKSPSDRVVEVAGIGSAAAAGFSVSEGGVLKLLAAESAAGMVGLRVRDPVKEGDEKFNGVKTLAAKALARLK